MNQSEKINELATALSKAQSQIVPAKKNGVNPFLKSKYADLCSVWEACQKPLTSNGLSIVHAMDYQDKQLVLLSTLLHTSGQWMRSVVPLPSDITNNKKDVQALGSALTYYKRYNLSALTGVVTDDDDDGCAAMSSSNNRSSERISLPIDKEKSNELQKILEECEPKYQSNFWSYLKQKVNGLQTIDQLPSDMYEQVKMGLIKKREEYLSNVVNGLNNVLAHA